MSNKKHIKTQDEIRKEEVSRFLEYARKFHEWYWRDKKDKKLNQNEEDESIRK